MLEALIPSQCRVKLLTLFLSNPGRAFYVREIERMTGENITAIRRELSNLESFGLLAREWKGKQLYFSVQQDFILYNELQRIILKTEGVSGVLREKFKDLEGLSCVFIFGSFAAGKAGAGSDIDLFVVGEIEEDALLSAIHTAEETLHREINYNLMSADEYRERLEKNDPFVVRVRREPRLILLGSCNGE